MFNINFISEQKTESPEEIGYFNIYIREPSPGAYRSRLQRVRFPVARYSRHRFRMYSLNLAFFSMYNNSI
jgi:hypothetical protein